MPQVVAASLRLAGQEQRVESELCCAGLAGKAPYLQALQKEPSSPKLEYGRKSQAPFLV